MIERTPWDSRIVVNQENPKRVVQDTAEKHHRDYSFKIASLMTNPSIDGFRHPLSNNERDIF